MTQGFSKSNSWRETSKNACHFLGKGTNKRMVSVLMFCIETRNEVQFVTLSRLKEVLIISQTNYCQPIHNFSFFTFSSSFYLLFSVGDFWFSKLGKARLYENQKLILRVRKRGVERSGLIIIFYNITPPQLFTGSQRLPFTLHFSLKRLLLISLH